MRRKSKRKSNNNNKEKKEKEKMKNIMRERVKEEVECLNCLS
jgi:hypothetical protein